MREVVDKLIIAARRGGYGTLRRDGRIGAMLREDAASVGTYPARVAAQELRRLLNPSDYLEGR